MHPILDQAPSPVTSSTPGADSERTHTLMSHALAVLLPLSFIATSIVSSTGTVALSVFGLVPVHTLHSRYLWNVLTHPFVEPSMVLLLLDLTVTLGVLRPLELGESTIQLDRAFVVPRLLVVTTVCVSVTLLLATPVMSIAFAAPFTACSFCGFFPLSIAILVLFWQKNPERDVICLANTLKMETRHLPLAAVCLCAVYDLAFGQGIPQEEDVNAGIVPVGPVTLTAIVSMHVGWVFLRFVDDRGDVSSTSDAFAYHQMFPGPFRVLAKALGRVVWPVFRCCGFGTRFTAAPHSADIEQVNAERGRLITSAPRTTNSVADRRRQLALAALSQRLDRVRNLESGGIDLSDATAPTA